MSKKTPKIQQPLQKEMHIFPRKQCFEWPVLWFLTPFVQVKRYEICVTLPFFFKKKKKRKKKKALSFSVIWN